MPGVSHVMHLHIIADILCFIALLHFRPNKDYINIYNIFEFLSQQILVKGKQHVSMCILGLHYSYCFPFRYTVWSFQVLTEGSYL